MFAVSLQNALFKNFNAAIKMIERNLKKFETFVKKTYSQQIYPRFHQFYLDHIYDWPKGTY